MTRLHPQGVVAPQVPISAYRHGISVYLILKIVLPSHDFSLPIVPAFCLPSHGISSFLSERWNFSLLPEHGISVYPVRFAQDSDHSVYPRNQFTGHKISVYSTPRAWNFTRGLPKISVYPRDQFIKKVMKR